MGIKFDSRALEAALLGMQEACDDLPQIAEKVRAEALGHAILGAQANIYNTQAGAYERTQTYLRGLDATARATRTTVTVAVSNDTEYAAYVEVGRGGMSYAMLQQLALMQGDPSDPLTLGRSGQRWVLPGPVLTGAQAYAAHRMRELFGEKVRAAVRR